MYRARTQRQGRLEQEPIAGGLADRSPVDAAGGKSGSLLSYLPGQEPRNTGGQAPPPSLRASRPDMWQMVQWLWQGRLAIALWIVLGLAAAFGLSKVLQPRFTTYTDLMINPAQLQLTSEDLYNTNSQREAQLLTVAGKMRMLTSTNVLSSVIDRLSLQNDPEFIGQDGNLSEEQRRLTALRALYERVSIRRDGQSYVATLSVWAGDPLKAISISEAIVEAFKLEVAKANAESSQRAATALNDRVETLRARANDASAKVETFRRQHQLEETGGELLTSQSLSQLNEQINNARERLMLAEARYDATRALRVGSRASDENTESEVLSSLRTRQAFLQEELQSKSVTLGPRHPTVSTLELRLKSVQRAVEAEITRMIEIASSDVEQAKAVQSQLLGQLKGTRGFASQDNEALLQLRELQREADVQAAIYKNYLQRRAEIAESSEVDVTDIRVISSPVPPESRSWPPRLLYLLAAGAILGAAIGVLWVLLSRLGRIYGRDIRHRLASAPA